jgi:hypothetical protein
VPPTATTSAVEWVTRQPSAMAMPTSARRGS